MEKVGKGREEERGDEMAGMRFSNVLIIGKAICESIRDKFTQEENIFGIQLRNASAMD